MKSRVSLGFVAVVLAGLLVLNVTPTKAEEKPFVVGGIFSITGPASYLGEPERNTVKMLEEQINAAGGINGHRLEVIVEDNEGDEAKAVMKVKKLINDKVVAIIGPTRSGDTIPIRSPDRSGKRCLRAAAGFTSGSPICSTTRPPTTGRCTASPTTTQVIMRAAMRRSRAP